MSSEIKADKWSPASGTSATIGDSGDTYTVPSGVTLDTSSSTLTLPSSVISGQTAITSLADTDKFLVSDASDSGNLKYVENQYLGGGNLVLISNYNVSSAVSTITFDNVFTTTYKNYLIISSNVQITATAKTTFNFRSGGSTLTGSYQQAMSGYRSGNSAIEYGNEGQTDFTTTIANDMYQGSAYSERMYIYDPKAGTEKRISQLGVMKDSNQHHATYHGTGVYTNGTTSIDGFILERTSGNFQTVGQITVYGIKNA